MGKKILVISHVASHPQNSGYRSRICTLLSNLKKMGHKIYFVCWDINMTTKEDQKEMKKFWDGFYLVRKHSLKNIFQIIDRNIGKIGIFLRKNIPGFNFKLKHSPNKSEKKQKTMPIDTWYPKFLNKEIIKLSKKIKFDIILVEYVFLSKVFECFDDSVFKLIDAHDVFSDLYKKYQKEGCQYDWIYLNAKEEAKGLRRADVIITIQNKDKEFFSRLVNRKIITIGHNVDLHKRKEKKLTTKRILFVGSNIHPNKKGIDYFIRNVFQKIKSKFPDARLIIVGAVCSSVEDFEGIVKLGEIKDIKTAYEMSDVVINPVSFGSGLKIKTIEALGYSKPLVTTSHGVIGLEAGTGKAFLVADNPKKFAEKIIEIFSDSRLYNKLSENAYNFAKKYNEKNLRELKKLMSYNKNKSSNFSV